MLSRHLRRDSRSFPRGMWKTSAARRSPLLEQALSGWIAAPCGKKLPPLGFRIWRARLKAAMTKAPRRRSAHRRRFEVATSAFSCSDRETRCRANGLRQLQETRPGNSADIPRRRSRMFETRKITGAGTAVPGSGIRSTPQLQRGVSGNLGRCGGAQSRPCAHLVRAIRAARMSLRSRSSAG